MNPELLYVTQPLHNYYFNPPKDMTAYLYWVSMLPWKVKIV